MDEDEVGSPGATVAEPAATVADPAVLAQLAAQAAAQMSAENFPVALRAVPRAPRAHLTRVYEYARFVDDVGDEAPGDRLVLLDAVEEQVRALWIGEPTLLPVLGLRPLIEQHAVPIEALLDLIQANRLDQRVTNYDTFDQLLDYCRLSAAPVGQLVLAIAERATAQNVADSDQVCAALQVLEHCQDVGEDARAGRIYLPAEDLRAHGVPDAQLIGSVTSPQLRQVVSTQVDRAQQLLQAGRPLVRRLPGWARLAVAGYVAGGLATIDALRAADYDVLGRHITPTTRRTVVHAVRLVTGI